MTRMKLMVAALGLVMCGAMPMAMAQEGGGRQGGRQGGGQWGGGGERPNMEQMRERMATRMKEDLKASDEDWAALQPAVEKVQRLQLQTRAGGFAGFGGRGGGPGGGAGAEAQSNPVAEASRNLQAALENETTSPDTIKSRLEALRKARETAREELTKAQNELRELLTVRQEAVLVTRGLLD